MKYYINFIQIPEETQGHGAPNPAVEVNEKYRFPTDPQYKQTGVYNQSCKYRLTNFQVANILSGELQDLNGKTLLIRFNNIRCMNNYTMVYKGGAFGTHYQFAGENPLEFHIRIDDNVVEQTASTNTITSNLTIDPYQIDIPKGSISDNASAGSVRVVDKNGTGADITGQITTAGAGSNSFLRSSFAMNTFTEEYIGGACWGQIPSIQYFIYDHHEQPATFLNSDTTLKDIALLYTLEIEPVAVRL